MPQKREFIEKFNKAFAVNDAEFITDHMIEDVIWTLMGKETFLGKKDVMEEFRKMKEENIIELTISHIITHELTASCNGIMKIICPAGNVETTAFCDVYKFDKFEPGKITEITSYYIPVTLDASKKNQI